MCLKGRKESKIQQIAPNHEAQLHSGIPYRERRRRIPTMKIKREIQPPPRIKIWLKLNLRNLKYRIKININNSSIL